MKVFLNHFEHSLKLFSCFCGFLGATYFYIKFSLIQYSEFAFYMLIFLIGLSFCFTIIYLFKELTYLFENKTELQNELEIQNLKESIILELQQNSEKLFNEQIPKYIYSKKFFKSNFALTLSIGVLSVQTNSKTLEIQIKDFICYIKRFQGINIYNLNLQDLKKINCKFNSIIDNF